MKQIEQMKGVTRCLSLTLVFLSIIYLITRVLSLIEMQNSKGKSAMMGRNRVTMSNIELVHYFTIFHAATCVGISALVGLTLKKSLHIDRRQFYLLMGITGAVTIIYFFALMFVVWKATQATTSQTSAFIILESVLLLIGTIATDPLSFIFALMMNFVLLFGIFLLNWSSMTLADLARALE